VVLLNVTVGDQGQAGMLAGISSAEPLTLEVRYRLVHARCWTGES